MRTIRKVVLGALVTVLAIAVLGSLASARRFAFSNETFRIAFPIAGEPPRAELVSCPFTLEGSFHSRTLSKVSGQLIGYVTRAVMVETACRNGQGRFLAETLPWHVRYESFLGFLPNIGAIRGQFIGLSFQLVYERLLNLTCLYVTEARRPSRFILIREAESKITAFRFDETALIPPVPGSNERCFEAFLFGTTELITVLNSTSRIFVGLVE
jgi:hypothetical protein